MTKNPHEGMKGGLGRACYHAWEEGQTAGDATGYTRGRSERDAEVAALREACRVNMSQIEAWIDQHPEHKDSWELPYGLLMDVIAKATEGEVKDNG